MTEVVANNTVASNTDESVPAAAVLEYYMDERSAGTCRDADLHTLHDRADEKMLDVRDGAKDCCADLKPQAEEFVQSVNEHAAALKNADADGVLTGAEFVKDGLPIVDGILDLDQS